MKEKEAIFKTNTEAALNYLVLHKFQNVFQNYLLHHLPKERGETD